MDVVSAAGTSHVFEQGMIQWTLGEVCIETYSENSTFFTQGFHQPSDKEFISIDPDFFIPEGYSPNDDEVNDVFFIRGINKFPNNSIVIYNRWGNKVFEASLYTNTWNGTNDFGITVGSNDLPIGTYFYLLDLGNNTPILKGTIYLTR